MPSPAELMMMVPDMLARLVDSGRPWIDHYGLAAVAFGLFCETLLFSGFIVPGFGILAAAGYFSAGGALSWWQALLAGVIGAVLGDQASFLLGRFVGLRLLWRWRGRADGLRRALEGDAVWLLLSYHYSWLLRAILPCTAGGTGFSYRRFALLDACGAALWVVAAYAVGWSAHGVLYSRGNLAMLALNLLSLILLVGVSWRATVMTRRYTRAAEKSRQ